MVKMRNKIYGFLQSNVADRETLNFIQPSHLARLMGQHPNGHFYNGLRCLEICDALHFHNAMYMTLADYGYVLEFNWPKIMLDMGLIADEN